MEIIKTVVSVWVLINFTLLCVDILMIVLDKDTWFALLPAPKDVSNRILKVLIIGTIYMTCPAGWMSLQIQKYKLDNDERRFNKEICRVALDKRRIVWCVKSFSEPKVFAVHRCKVVKLTRRHVYVEYPNGDIIWLAHNSRMLCLSETEAAEVCTALNNLKEEED